VAKSERSRPETYPNVGKIPQGSLSLAVSRQLLELLASREIGAGSRLPSERDLSELFGVARNAIRDGLRPLALLGILEVRPGSGTYVKSTTADLLPDVVEWGLLLGEPTIRDLVEARIYLEAGLSELASQRRDGQTVRSLRSLVGKMRDARSPEDFVKADLAFHLRLAEASGNDVLIGMLRNIRALLTVWIRRVVMNHPDLADLYAQHQEIFDAIVAQDPVAAGEAMKRHLVDVAGQLAAGLDLERGRQAENVASTSQEDKGEAWES
jgi:GntR family transcriptional regulator, transcriptional repressor for pyruvate dehydrogenase complex